MAELVDANGVFVEGIGQRSGAQGMTLYRVLRRLWTDIFFPGDQGKYSSTPMVLRIKGSLADNLPILRQASRNTGRNILSWVRRGSYLRVLLVVFVGTIILLSLTGLPIFMLFLLAAIISAVILSLLTSLATAGGLLAFFFACVTAISIGALSVVAFVILIATISTIVAVTTVTGWIGFFCAVWSVTKKSMELANHSLIMTGSALSTYSLTKHVRSRH
ncbi:hypothetical protein NMG60_11026512 [Bertholletia excelsa]